jgi:outer membrane lipopolysaccharide assembly protein LptE/RlpB
MKKLNTLIALATITLFAACGSEDYSSQIENETSEIDESSFIEYGQEVDASLENTAAEVASSDIEVVAIDSEDMEKSTATASSSGNNRSNILEKTPVGNSIESASAFMASQNKDESNHRLDLAKDRFRSDSDDILAKEKDVDFLGYEYALSDTDQAIDQTVTISDAAFLYTPTSMRTWEGYTCPQGELVSDIRGYGNKNVDWWYEDKNFISLFKIRCAPFSGGQIDRSALSSWQAAGSDYGHVDTSNHETASFKDEWLPHSLDLLGLFNVDEVITMGVSVSGGFDPIDESVSETVGDRIDPNNYSPAIIISDTLSCGDDRVMVGLEVRHDTGYGAIRSMRIICRGIETSYMN